MAKSLTLGPILVHLAQIGAAIFYFILFFFFKNLALSVTRYHHQLSSCTILEKTSDTILRKLNEKWTDGWTRLIL